jgi:hypothetical protein
MLCCVAILYSVYFFSIQFLVFLQKVDAKIIFQSFGNVGCYINHMYYNIYILLITSIDSLSLFLGSTSGSSNDDFPIRR